VPPLVRHPRGDLKDVTDANTAEFVALLNGPAGDMRAQLHEPQHMVQAALAAFFLTLRPDEPFTVGDYRRFLQFLLRWPDGKVRARPSWEADLRDNVRALLQHGRILAGYMAVRHVVEQARAAGTRVQVNPEEFVARAGRGFAAEESKQSSHYAREQVDQIKRRLASGIGVSTSTLVHQLQRLGGRKEALRDVEDAGGSAEAVAAAFFAAAALSARRLGVTELAAAYNAQARMAMVALDRVQPDVYFKRWDSAKDRRLCVSCREMHGITIPIDNRFPRDGGMGPPRHPWCRCTLTVFPVRRESNAD
jgi:hypothetical protein